MRMKKMNILYVLLITIFVALWTLSATDHCFAQTELTMGVPYSDTMSSSGEQKYYLINVPAGVNLFVMLDKDSCWDSEIIIKYAEPLPYWDYDDKDGGNGDYSDQAVEISSTQAGYYYIRVKSHHYAAGSYNVTAHDNTTLPALTMNVPAAGSLSWNEDEVYYQIQVPAGDRLFVMLDKDSRWDSEIMIKYGALPTDADNDAKGGGNGDYSEQAVEISSTQLGYYYIRVKSFYSSGGSYIITPRTSLDELTSDTPVSGDLTWRGETQYYEILIPSGEHLYVKLNKDSSWNSTIYIRCGALPTPTEYDAMMSGNSDLEVDIPYTQGGYCYVMIVSNSYSGGSFTSSTQSHLSEVNPDIHYSYDSLGRLIGVTYPSGTQITYSYDERGNRLEYIVAAGFAGDFEPDGDVD